MTLLNQIVHQQSKEFSMSLPKVVCSEDSKIDSFKKSILAAMHRLELKKKRLEFEAGEIIDEIFKDKSHTCKHDDCRTVFLITIPGVVTLGFVVFNKKSYSLSEDGRKIAVKHNEMLYAVT